jgi:hypothetical protein
MIVLILLCIPAFLPAGQGLKNWRLEFGLSSSYDGNALRYSDKYLERFERQEDEGRFHIATRDDLILTNSLRTVATLEILDNALTQVATTFRHYSYTSNSLKDWSYYSMSFRQELGQRMAVGVAYEYVPEFYIKHYRDEDWVEHFGNSSKTFQPFEYRKDEISGWLQKMFFGNTRVRALLSYGRYFHNQHFTEYDSKYKQVGFEIGQPVISRLKVVAGYSFAASHAGGDAETDPSFDEDKYSLSVQWQLPSIVGRSNLLVIDGEYAYCCFTSKRSADADRLHAGRWDRDYRMSLVYTVQLSGRILLDLRYEWHQRNASTSAVLNAEYLAEDKDFNQHQIGIEAKYVVNIFSADDSESEGDQ